MSKIGEPTNAIRMVVIDELIAELKSYGHYNAVTHVEGCKKRLQTRMDRVDYWKSKTGGHHHERRATAKLDRKTAGQSG